MTVTPCVDEKPLHHHHHHASRLHKLHRQLEHAGPPPAMRQLDKAAASVLGLGDHARLYTYRVYILVLTFLCYTAYHMSRKPISVVKNEFLNCTAIGLNGTEIDEEDANCTSFMDELDGQSYQKASALLGTLDTTYLFAYAFGMFFSGIVAERIDLRYFLSFGMIISGIFVILFGIGYFIPITSIYYYIFIQVMSGIVQTTGWPGVVTVVANWFGKGKKGFIFGVWNSHTSVGNILGSILAGMFVTTDWGLSFIVPGALLAGFGIALFFLLIPRPEDVGLDVDTGSASTSRAPQPHPRRVVIPSFHSFAVSVGSAQDLQETTPLLVAGKERFSDMESDVTIEEPSEKPAESDDKESCTSSVSTATSIEEEEQPPITFLGALKIPGVLEYSLSLFFSKLVSYTFLFWLPFFIEHTGDHIEPDQAAYLSTLFDIGGIVGGISAGLISDFSGKSASTCACMLITAIPTLFIYQWYGTDCPLDPEDKSSCYGGNIALLVVLGLLVNGPYALITTAVSADLGTHPSLRGSSHALATVTSIIDGTGSIGAAIGPFIAGAVPIEDVFYILMGADVIALIMLARLITRELRPVAERIWWKYRSRR